MADAPVFIATDPAQVVADLVALYQATTGKTLQPAQIERLLIDVVAFRESQVRVGIQYACEQQLVAFAVGSNLDNLGLLVGVPRLGAMGSTTRLRVTLNAAQTADYPVALGYIVQTTDGKATFATVQTLLIPKGQLTGEVDALCQSTGSATNGYQPGDVSVPITILPEVALVQNITVTANGVDPETDDHLRQRIFEAPDHFSVAGPLGAYRFFALSTHPDIVDVSVESLMPGVVSVYPLMSTGLPDGAMVALVQAALNADDVRPVCDEVDVAAPTQVPYTIQVNVVPVTGQDPVALQQAIQARAQAFLYGETKADGTTTTGRQMQLGMDLVPSQILAALSVPGIYDMQVVSPAFLVVDPGQWANCTGVTVTMLGASDA